MALVALLVIVAIVFGGLGLILKAAWWAFVIAVVLLVAGAVLGFTRRGASA